MKMTTRFPPPPAAFSPYGPDGVQRRRPGTPKPAMRAKERPAARLDHRGLPIVRVKAGSRPL
jgi:hypothetical protein